MDNSLVKGRWCGKTGAMTKPSRETLPTVPVVRECDIPSRRVLDERFSLSDDHDDVTGDEVVVQHETFGDDPVTRAVASVEGWIERALESLSVATVESTGSANPLRPKRFAQVIQATRTPLDEVLSALEARQGTWHERLRIDRRLPPSKGTGRQEIMFAARLRMPIVGRRAVTLRVYPTPSRNLTVIEMLPTRRWMPQTRLYLHVGVPAITQLMRRLGSRSSGLHEQLRA